MGVILVLAPHGALLLWPWAQWPVVMQRTLMPHALIAPASVTQIELQVTPAPVMHGDTVSITAHLDQHDTGEVLVHLAYADDSPVSRLMRFESGAYQFELPDVTRDFSFYVTAGDARTLRHEVRVLRRPMVREYRIRYDFPDYTGRTPINVLSP